MNISGKSAVGKKWNVVMIAIVIKMYIVHILKTSYSYIQLQIYFVYIYGSSAD